MAKEVSPEQLFENIALDNQLITKFQLEKAKKALEEREDGDSSNLGGVLVEMGFITEKQLDSIKSAQTYRTTRNDDKRFGRQVVRMKLTKPNVVQDLLKKQKETYEKTGKTVTLPQLLLKEGELTKKDIRTIREELASRDSQKISERQKAVADSQRHFVQCPNCGSKLLIKPHNFDKTVKCSSCATRFKATANNDRKTDNFDMPIVADLDNDNDDEDEDVIDIEEIELEEFEQKAVASAPSSPIDDDIFDNLPDDQGLTDLDDHTAPDEDDLADLDDLDPDALKSDQFDLDDDLDIDDLDIDNLDEMDDDVVASDVLKSDSVPEDEFDEDLDDDFLKDLDDDEEIDDISDVDSDLTDLQSDDLDSDSEDLDDIEPMEDLDDLEDIGKPDTGLGGLEINDGFLDSGMDASWATNAFDDRPIHARPEDDVVESLVPLDKAEDVTQTVDFDENGAAIISEPEDDIPGASVLDDDDLYENLEEEKIGTNQPPAPSIDSGYGTLKSPERVIKSVPVATSSKELDAEISAVPALGTLLEDIPDEDIESDLEGVKTAPGLNNELKSFLNENVDSLAEDETINESYPDSLILNREANSDPANTRPEKPKVVAPNPFAAPVEEATPLAQQEKQRETRVFSQSRLQADIPAAKEAKVDSAERTERVANFAEELTLKALDWIGTSKLSEDEVREAFDKALKVILEDLQKKKA